jgi:hypothetical protein
LTWFNVADNTHKVKPVIADPKMITPTGTFSVWNTRHNTCCANANSVEMPELACSADIRCHPHRQENRMRTFKPVTVAIAVALLEMSGAVQAAPNWNEVPRKTIMVFYPGTASIEWTFGSAEHGGKRAIRKGETCAGCHTGEAVVMGNKMVTGKRLEPNAAAVKGKAGSIPVTVQAAYEDG